MTRHLTDLSPDDAPAEGARREPRPLRLRHLVVACLVAAFLGGSVSSYASHTFPDVPNGHPFHQQISWLAGAGITGGFGDGTFRPEAGVTRGQMAAFMQRLYNLQAGLYATRTSATSNSFSTTTWETVPDGSLQVTIPPGTTGRIVARFSAQTSCRNTGGTDLIFRGTCRIRIRHGSTVMNPELADSVVESVSYPPSIFGAASTRSIERASGVLGPGTYTVSVQASATASGGFCVPPCTPPTSATTFDLQQWFLSAQVVLADAPT